jgi:small conductance mechanosensitive channel
MEEQLGQLERIVDMIIDYVVKYAFQILGALVVLVVGMFVARWVAGVVIRLCKKAEMDVTLTMFLGSVTKALVMVFVIIAVISQFGISIAPMIAALGAILFGASFAIAGPLSNYGAGLVIILTRPFVVGNTISIKGVSGVVEEVKLAATILSTEDGEQITIPNKHIVGEVLTNSFECRIVEGQVGISYADDPAKAIDIIRNVIAGFKEIPDDPAPIIGIQEYGDSAVHIGMRYWVPTRDYFKVRYAVNLAVYQKLQEAGITIPFPQRDIHIRSGSEKSSALT